MKRVCLLLCCLLALVPNRIPAQQAGADRLEADLLPELRIHQAVFQAKIRTDGGDRLHLYRLYPHSGDLGRGRLGERLLACVRRWDCSHNHARQRRVPPPAPRSADRAARLRPLHTERGTGIPRAEEK